MVCWHLAAQPAWACTETALKGPLEENAGGKTQAFVSARTVDFDLPLGNIFVQVPRNVKWKSRFPGDDPAAKPEEWYGKEWTNQYGFIGLNAQNIYQDTPWTFMDGINERGLSVSLLWLEETKYPIPSPDDKKERRALSGNDFVAWVLGNFEDVGQVKSRLSFNSKDKQPSDIVVWGEKAEVKIPGQGTKKYKIPVHAMLHDAQGHSMVIEALDHKLVFYDPDELKDKRKNFVDAMGNREYMKDFENLNDEKYKNLVCGTRASESGPEEGLLGLPGDMSASSRFVTVAKISQCTMTDLIQQRVNGNIINPLNTEDKAVQAAWRVIGRVERAPDESLSDTTPAEDAEASDPSIFKRSVTLVKETTPTPAAPTGDIPKDRAREYHVDLARVTVVRVHNLAKEDTQEAKGKSRAKIYFRTADNQSVRLIDLSKLNFSNPGGGSVNKDLFKGWQKWVADTTGYKAEDVTDRPTPSQ